MRRFTKDEISRMRQLRKAGFSLLTIARVFETDRETVYYHVRSDNKGNLVEFAKSLLPHLPSEGPPLPRGYSLTWVESRRLKREKTKKIKQTAERQI